MNNTKLLLVLAISIITSGLAAQDMASPSLLTGKKDIYLTPDMAKIEGTGYHENRKDNPRLNSGIENASFTVNRRFFDHAISFHANTGGWGGNDTVRNWAIRQSQKGQEITPHHIQFVFPLNGKYNWFSGYFALEDMMIEDFFTCRSEYNVGYKITIYVDQKEVFTSQLAAQEIGTVERNTPHYFCVNTAGAKELKIRFDRPETSFSINGILLEPKLHIAKEKPVEPALPPQQNEAKMSGKAPAPKTPWAVWSRKPAQWWSSKSYRNDAYPLGNGFLGGMIFGGINMERVGMNEHSFWTDVPDQVDDAGKVVKYTKGNVRKKIAVDTIVGGKKGQYIPLGNLFIDPVDLDAVKNYRRELDMDEGMVKVQYESDGVLYRREYFFSYPDDAMVVRLSANKKGMISGRYYLDANPRTEFERSLDNNAIVMSGEIIDNGMKFDSRLLVKNNGGRVTRNTESITVEGADEVTLVFVADTEFVNTYPTFTGIDPIEENRKKLQDLVGRSYTELRKRHVDDYASLMSRFYIDFEGAADLSQLETSERKTRLYENGLDLTTNTLEHVKHWDPQLFALYVQWGRHLIISASRPGSMPLNQCFWQESLLPIWQGHYQFDINMQMHYWLNDVTGLQETVEPLIDFLENISTGTGPLVAKEFADFDGHEPGGWAMNFKASLHSVQYSALDGGTSAGWILMRVWEHYLFTMDKNFLAERCYPLTKGAAEFLSNHLRPNAEGQLMMPHGQSWEGRPTAIVDGDKLYSINGMKPGTFRKYPELDHDKYDTEHLDDLCGHPQGHFIPFRHHDETSCDLQITKNTFESVIEMSKILGKDKAFAEKLQAQLKKMSPALKIGAGGQIQEWANPYWEQTGQRHMSHLLCLFPFHMISPVTTPEYAQAAMKSLDYRGYGGTTSWSHGWKVCLLARLFNGDAALKQLYHQMYSHVPSEGDNLFTIHNLLVNDGNLSAAAGIVEMLVQSHSGFIHLLPALPKLLPEGEVRGLKARGDNTVDMQWKDGALVSARIHSGQGGTCRVLYGHQMLKLKIRAGKSFSLTLADFAKGETIDYEKPQTKGTIKAIRVK